MVIYFSSFYFWILIVIHFASISRWFSFTSRDSLNFAAWKPLPSDNDGGPAAKRSFCGRPSVDGRGFVSTLAYLIRLRYASHFKSIPRRFHRRQTYRYVISYAWEKNPCPSTKRHPCKTELAYFSFLLLHELPKSLLLVLVSLFLDALSHLCKSVSIHPMVKQELNFRERGIFTARTHLLYRLNRIVPVSRLLLTILLLTILTIAFIGTFNYHSLSSYTFLSQVVSSLDYSAARHRWPLRILRPLLRARWTGLLTRAPPFIAW